jgi:hypothetical protein
MHNQLNMSKNVVTTQLKKVLIPTIIVFGAFFVTWSVSAADLTLKNPLSTADPRVFIGQIIRSVIGLVGTLALVMFIYGGLTWMLSAGSADKVKKGKDIFVWATLGLIMVFSSYMLVRFIFNFLK